MSLSTNTPGNACEVFFVPGETVQTAKNVGSDNAAELATYAVEEASRSSWSSSEEARDIAT